MAVLNKKGGPDRRFNVNKQLPVCLYGEIDFESDSGLNGKIQLSNPDAVDRFPKIIDALSRADSSAVLPKAFTSVRNAKTWPSVLFGCSFVLSSVAFCLLILSTYKHVLPPPNAGPGQVGNPSPSIVSPKKAAGEEQAVVPPAAEQPSPVPLPRPRPYPVNRGP